MPYNVESRINLLKTFLEEILDDLSHLPEDFGVNFRQIKDRLDKEFKWLDFREEYK